MPSLTLFPKLICTKCVMQYDQAVRELRNRFDFRGVDASIELEDQSI
ncbi:MAG: hypothetical protein CM15mP68_2090 [Pseudomonadota bacterium]|nr:MAG: hypothetical protein CM15mP68_2090 [Pseudomonadota bacterium]